MDSIWIASRVCARCRFIQLISQWPISYGQRKRFFKPTEESTISTTCNNVMVLSYPHNSYLL